MSKKICVIGGATWDVLFTTPRAQVISSSGQHQKLLAFPYGGKIYADNIVYGFGGGAANVAIGLSKLGLKTTIIARVGRDWRGREIVKNFRSFGVSTAMLQFDSAHPSAMSFVVTSGGERDHIAFVSRTITGGLALPKNLVGFDWCYLNSLPPKLYSNLILLSKRLKRQGTKIFWNPGAHEILSKPLLKSILPFVEILDLNRDEANIAIRTMGFKAVGQPQQILSTLHKQGAKNVLMTDGAAGAYFYDGVISLHQPSFRVKIANTIGAGDAFGSGFLAEYAQSSDIKESLLWGMRNATSVIQQAGAQKGLLDAKEMFKLRR